MIAPNLAISAGPTLGYYVLVKSPYHDEAPWESDWDGELYFDREAAVASARQASVGGYRSSVCALVLLGDVVEPAQQIEPHAFRDGTDGDMECAICGGSLGGPWHTGTLQWESAARHAALSERNV